MRLAGRQLAESNGGAESDYLTCRRFGDLRTERGVFPTEVVGLIVVPNWFTVAVHECCIGDHFPRVMVARIALGDIAAVQGRIARGGVVRASGVV